MTNENVEYCGSKGPSEEDIKKEFSCEQENAEKIVEILNHGYVLGKNGIYINQDFSSWADWCYGDGAKMTNVSSKIEEGCTNKYWAEDVLFEMYLEAHSKGLVEGGHNVDSEN